MPKNFLPNAHSAIIPVEKLTNYVLNSEHPRGGSKAYRIRQATGLTDADAGAVTDQIRNQIMSAACVQERTDWYGRRYSVRLVLDEPKGSLTVQTCWIVRRAKIIQGSRRSYLANRSSAIHSRDDREGPIRMLDVVRLKRGYPEAGLSEGATGTVVEILERPELAYEVEFTDDDGEFLAEVPVTPDELSFVERPKPRA